MVALREDILCSPIDERVAADMEMHRVLQQNPNVVAILTLLGSNPGIGFGSAEIADTLGIDQNIVYATLEYINELTEKYPNDLSFDIEEKEVTERQCSLIRTKKQTDITACSTELVGTTLKRRDLLITFLFLVEHIDRGLTISEIRKGIPIDKSRSGVFNTLTLLGHLMSERADLLPVQLEVNRDEIPHRYSLTTKDEMSVNDAGIRDALPILAIKDACTASIFFDLLSQEGKAVDFYALKDKTGIDEDALDQKLLDIKRFLDKYPVLNFALDRSYLRYKRSTLVMKDLPDDWCPAPIPYITRTRATGVTKITDTTKNRILRASRAPSEVKLMEGTPPGSKYLLANASKILFEESGQMAVPALLLPYTVEDQSVSTDLFRRLLMRELECDNSQATDLIGWSEEKVARHALELGFGIYVGGGYITMQFFDTADRRQALANKYRLRTPEKILGAWFFDPAMKFAKNATYLRTKNAHRDELLTDEEVRVIRMSCIAENKHEHPVVDDLAERCGFHSKAPLERIMESLMAKRFQTGIYVRTRFVGTECVNLSMPACKRVLAKGISAIS